VAKRSRQAATISEVSASDLLSQIITDRNALRDARLTEAARAVADKAQGGENVLAEIRKKHGGGVHVYRVNPYDLDFEDGINTRDFTPPDMQQRVVDLALSIAIEGVKQPLDIYPKGGRIYVNGGETRWRATMHVLNFLNVAVERIPIIIAQNQNDLDRAVNRWLGNDTNRFKPMEAALQLQQMRNLGADDYEISRRIGRPISFVRDHLKYLELPEWLKSDVASGKLSAPTAYKDFWLASGEDTDKAKAMLKQAAITQAETGSRRVMPRHIGKLSVTKQLANLLGEIDREALEKLIGAERVESLFKLAKL